MGIFNKKENEITLKLTEVLEKQVEVLEGIRTENNSTSSINSVVCENDDEATSNTLATAIERHVISAPGIINAKYKGDFITRPMKYGMINVVESYENAKIITEKERIYGK